jgi:lipoprotein signal peptidase
LFYDTNMTEPTSPKPVSNFKRRLGLALLAGLLLAGFDLLIKYWVYLHLNLRPTTDFNATLPPAAGVINQTLTGGQSFAPLILISLSLAFLFLVCLLFAVPGKLSWLSTTLLLAALFGNGSERIITGGVIDYWTLALPRHLYLVINLADLLALAGAILMVLYLWQYFRQRSVEEEGEESYV